MGKIKYGLALIAIGGIIATSVPYFTKNSIENIINHKQNEFNINGIDLIVLKSTGYISSKRELLIKVEDSIKFIDFMTKTLELDIKILNNITNNGDLLENLALKGIMLNTNIFPENIDVSLSIEELPKSFKMLMKKEPIFKKLIDSLNLKLKIDADGNITYAGLNDIIINVDDISAKILKPKIFINKNNYLTSIQDVTLKINGSNKFIYVNINDVKDDLNYENSFNLNEVTTIQNIKFNYRDTNQSKNKKIIFTSGKNEIKVNFSSKNNELSMSTDYIVKDTTLYTNDIDTTIEDLKLKVAFTGLKEEPIKELLNYKSTELEVLDIAESRLQEIINYGFSLNLESNIDNLKNNKPKKFEVKNINFNLVANIEKNNLNKNSTKKDILKNISLIGVIKMDKNLTDFMKPIQKYNTNIINGVSNFDIKFIDGKLVVNNNRIN